MVAGEIAQDRLYVVANGLVPGEYFSNPAAEQANQRLSAAGHDLDRPAGSGPEPEDRIM